MAKRKKTVAGGGLGGLILVGVILACCGGLCGIDKNNNNSANVPLAPAYLLSPSPTPSPPTLQSNTRTLSSQKDAGTTFYSNQKPARKAEVAPVINNSGASAKCADGTLSYSAHRRGTCSHHGGVAEWY